MRIHTTINERTLRRTFREQKFGRTGLTVIDRDLPAFGLKVAKNGTRTFFVRAVCKSGAQNLVLGTTDEMTAAEAREKAATVIAAATVVVSNTAGDVTSSAATLTVTPATVAPAITTQPTNQTVTVGGSATFTVAATGTPTPTYQWRFDGSDISGATSASYTISSAALTNAGDYTVVVTNTAGNVTSSAATLTVTAAAVAPQITTQPTDQSVTVGGSATFTVAATGTPTPTYQWHFDGSAISGATSASYTISSAALTNAGDYTVVVTNTAGNVTSSAATLTVTAAAVAPQITTQPTDQSVTVGGSATFTVAATGTPTPTYQWHFDGSAISGATSASYTISSAALTNAGDYTVVVTNTAGNVTSSAATLTVTAPDLTVDGVSVSSASVVEGASFTINATVNNEGDGASAATTLTYYRSADATITTDDTSIGTDPIGILAANGSSTQDASVSIATAGTYHVGACVPTVSGETDTDNNCSTGVQVTVTAATVAPQITTQPADQSVTVGDDATFTVAATGTPAPTYQWRFEGSDISGATSASYTLSNAALTNAGDYTVVVTNTAGTVTSSAATLTVTPATVAPAITTQPTDQSVTVGGSATFTVAATGTPTPTYQWHFDGSAISGATSASYTISSAALTNAGDYTVVVTNTAGDVTSSAATLTVTPATVAPAITTQPTNQTVTVGDDATFTVAATGTPAPTYQWHFDGSAISGATSASYTISSAALTNAGDYTVVVTNTAGDVTSSAATLTVTPATVAPAITTQPTNQTVTVGDDATFTVAATGTPAPTYQWHFDGSAISGATSASYTVSNAALTNAGDYTVVVTNTAGDVTSSAATLTVTPATVAPAITTQPTNQTVTVGDDATFTVAATGTPAPTYQWHFDGSAISGATSASYTISSAALTNAGDYTVVVTNTAGDVTSSAATLTVTPATVAPEPSVLIEPRRIGAGTALRRHVGRFDRMTGTVVRARLRGSIMKTLTLSENIGSGGAAAGGRLGKTRWGSWIDGSYAGFGGKATGRQADVYGGFDFLGGNGKWLIGALAGHEVADLKIGKATYSTNYTHLGLYGGVRLSDRLVFDGALTYGMATPEVALGDVSASYDANRITARIALTGDFGLIHGLGIGPVRVEPQVGLLYSREALGAFTDSAGGVAGGEVLELGRFSFGPRLTRDFDWGQVVGGARVQWDFLQIEDGVDGRLSGAADIGLRFDIAPGVTLGVHGNADGIGITDGFGSLGGRVQLDARF